MYLNISSLCLTLGRQKMKTTDSISIIMNVLLNENIFKEDDFLRRIEHEKS